MKYQVEENFCCFKCGSRNVGRLFEHTIDPMSKLNRATGEEEPVDGENYLFHHDCYFCNDCKAWDFPDPDLWYRPVLVGGFTCECGCTRLKVTYNDILQDTFEVECTECKKAYELEKEKSTDKDWE